MDESEQPVRNEPEVGNGGRPYENGWRDIDKLIRALEGDEQKQEAEAKHVA
jgi:hypothetical protein